MQRPSVGIVVGLGLILLLDGLTDTRAASTKRS